MPLVRAVTIILSPIYRYDYNFDTKPCKYGSIIYIVLLKYAYSRLRSERCHLLQDTRQFALQ
jgi:hypothetical protein